MKTLAFTYDDGPNTHYTLNLLDVLKAHDVRATFFMIGKHVKADPVTACKVAGYGHTIGNHTYTHPRLQEITFEKAVEEIEDCQKVLDAVVGPHSRLFRAPHLLSTPAIDSYLQEQGLISVLKTSSGIDWQPSSADTIVNNVEASQSFNNSGIILLHDGYHEYIGEPRQTTVEATDVLLWNYKRLGYKFTGDPTSIK